MRAVVVTADQSLQVQEAPDPVPAPGEALVEVAAAGVNRADLLQRRGHYPPPPGASPILGLELSGVLVDAAAGLEAGSRVMALVSGGGYASRAAVPVGQLLPVPEPLSFAEAAAVPEAFLTAFHNLFDRGSLQAGETVLIHAAGSGVGTAAIQLARRSGARVLVTSRSAEKLERCRELGADAGIQVSDNRFADRVLELANGGVQLILDFVGAPYWNENIRSLAVEGRMALIGTLGGSETTVDIGTLMRKRLRVTGSTLRGQSVEEKAALTARGAPMLLEGLGNGALRPILECALPLEQAEDAHRMMEEGRNFGKIVLTV